MLQCCAGVGGIVTVNMTADLSTALSSAGSGSSVTVSLINHLTLSGQSFNVSGFSLTVVGNVSACLAVSASLLNPPPPPAAALLQPPGGPNCAGCPSAPAAGVNCSLCGGASPGPQQQVNCTGCSNSPAQGVNCSVCGGGVPAPQPLNCNGCPNNPPQGVNCSNCPNNSGNNTCSARATCGGLNQMACCGRNAEPTCATCGGSGQSPCPLWAVLCGVQGKPACCGRGQEPDCVCQAPPSGRRRLLSPTQRVSVRAQPILRRRHLTQQSPTPASWRNPSTYTLCTIDGYSLSRIFQLTNGATLTLVNVSLVGGATTVAVGQQQLSNPLAGKGGAIYSDSTSNVVLVDSQLAYNLASFYGGAVYVGNTAAGAFSATRVTFSQNSAPQASNQLSTNPGGGAIFTEGIVTLTSCVFDSNSADRGGGVYAVRGVNATASHFALNTGSNGGAIYVQLANSSAYADLEGCSFLQNEAWGGTGGAVSMTSGSNTTLVAHACTFTQNSASNGGGALAGDGLDVRLCTFISNIVASDGHIGGGGAMSVQGTAPVSIADSVFLANSCENNGGGGALAIIKTAPYANGLNGPYDWTDVTLSNVSLQLNEASAGNGGGAAVITTARVAASGLSCNGNAAAGTPGRGGCLLLDSASSLSLVSSVLENNVATGDGGALAAICTSITSQAVNFTCDGSLTLTDVTATTNSAPFGSGGALHLQSGIASLSLLRVTLDSNVAAVDGGALVAAVPVAATVTGSALRNNAAGVSGGAIALIGGSLSAVNTELNNNIARGVSPRGGALYLADGVGAPFHAAGAALTKCTFINNTVTTVVATLSPGGSYSLFFGHGNGGAVFASAGAAAVPLALVFSACSLADNSAAQDGGGAFVYGSVALRLTSSTLVANTCGGAGGGLLQRASDPADGAVVDIAGGISFVNNSAISGAALALGSGVALTGEDAVLQGNRAVNGACFALLVSAYPEGVTAPEVTLQNVTMVSNVAYVGGAYFTDASEPIELPVCDACLLANTAQAYGEVYGSSPVTFNVSAPDTPRSGAALGLEVRLLDAFGQNVTAWPSVVASASCDVAGALSGASAAAYADGAARFSGLALTGMPGQTLQVTVSVSGASLEPAATDALAVLNLTIAACRPDEVFDAALDMRCECLAGSAPASDGDTCEPCPPGQFASLNGSQSCASCPPGTVAPLSGAVACTTCPPNAVSANGACICAEGFYDAASDAGAPSCQACPRGGACTAGGLLANEGFWREFPGETTFHRCREGFCLAEAAHGASAPARKRHVLAQAAPAAVSTTGNCAPGHTGVLCAVCLEGYTFQGGFCKPCPPEDEFGNWSRGQQAGVLAGCFAFAATFFAFAFFQPISPPVERAAGAITAAVKSVAESIKSCVLRVCCCCCAQASTAPDNSSDATAACHATTTTTSTDQCKTTVPVESLLTGLSPHEGEHHHLAPQLLHAPRHSGFAHGVVTDARDAAAGHAAIANAALDVGSTLGGLLGNDGASEGCSEGSSGFDEGLAEHLDFMDWLEERLERLQKFAKIIVKCASHHTGNLKWLARAATDSGPFHRSFYQVDASAARAPRGGISDVCLHRRSCPRS